MKRLDLIKKINDILGKHSGDPCSVCKKLIAIKDEEEKQRPDKRGGYRKEARARNVQAVETLEGLM